MEPRAGLNRARLASITLLLGALTAVSIALIDAPVALAVGRLPLFIVNAADQFIGLMEVAFGLRLSIYAAGFSLIGLAGILAVRSSRRSAARMLFWIAAIQLTTRFLVDVLKPVIDRLRPYEAIANGVVHDQFFTAAGNSFPSGHAAHFWGFFFALAVVCPRFRVPLIALPLAVSAARVISNDHYVGDVIASAVVAALVTTAFYGRLAAVHISRQVVGTSERPSAA